MTLIGAMVCGDHVRVVADSAYIDGNGGMIVGQEKAWRIGPSLVGGCSGQMRMAAEVKRRIGELPFDVGLPQNIRRAVGLTIKPEFEAIKEVIPEGMPLTAAHFVSVVIAGRWPDGRLAIYDVSADLNAGFSDAPWSFIGSAGDHARAALGAIQLWQGEDFAYTDRVLDVCSEAGAVFGRKDVGRPFMVWTIGREDPPSFEWIDRLLPWKQ